MSKNALPRNIDSRTFQRAEALSRARPEAWGLTVSPAPSRVRKYRGKIIGESKSL